PQPPARARLAALGERRHRLDLALELAGVVEQGGTELGDVEATGGAQQQALAELLLQPRQPARDGGFGQAEPVGRGGEAALGHDAGEDEQVAGVDLFHMWNNHVLRWGLMQSPASNTLQSIPSPSQRTSS